MIELLVKIAPPTGLLLTLASFQVHASADTVLLVVAGVVFAIATWKSRAPGLMRQDISALAGRVKTLEREKEEALAAMHKLTGEIAARETQIAELRAKDTSALYDLMVKNGVEQKEILQAILAAVSPPIHTVIDTEGE